MLRAHAIVTDYLEGRPIADAELAVSASIWAEVTVPPDGSDLSIQPPPVDSEGDGPDAADLHSQPGPGGYRPHRANTPSTLLPEQVVRTDERGEAYVDFDESDALTAIRGNPLLQKGAAVVKVVVRAHVKHLGIERDIRGRRNIALQPAPDDKPSVVELPLRIDHAKLIVGHTTRTSSTLWFQRHGELVANATYRCRVTEMRQVPMHSPASASAAAAVGSGGSVTVLPHGAAHSVVAHPQPAIPAGAAGTAYIPAEVASIGVTFDEARAAHAVVPITNLQPGTAYAVRLVLERPGKDPVLLVMGGFRTLPAAEDVLHFAFGSCHNPLTRFDAYERWRALAERSDDFLLLIGDQIYGDGLEETTDVGSGEDPWLQPYVQRYNQFWTPKPVRDVMRTRPVYMILDDHELQDDWGETASDPARRRGAEEAYKIYEQSHGLLGLASPTHYYHFRAGPAAFFVMDGRTYRGQETQHSILGTAQWEALKAWAASEEVRDADVIFLVAPVPLAFISYQHLQTVRHGADAAGGGLLGAIVGGIVGGLTGGPAGILVGAYAGATVGAEAGVLLGEVGYGPTNVAAGSTDIEHDWDIADQWNAPAHRAELAGVIELLFQIANDAQPGGNGSRKRFVACLSGDVHMGAMHTLVADVDKLPQWAGNRILHQFVSSPISNGPSNAMMQEYAGQDHRSVAGYIAGGGGKKQFTLLPDVTAQILGGVTDRNFGTVSIRRTDDTERIYQIEVALATRSGVDGLRRRLTVNLDSSQVEPIVQTAIVRDH